MNKRIFKCEDSLEGILTAIYYAWAKDGKHDLIRIELANQYYENEFFADYEEITPDDIIYAKVRDSIIRKISFQAYEMVAKAACSCNNDKGNRIYQFLVKGFRHGSKVSDMLYDEDVNGIFKLSRHVSNEVHKMLGFVRFKRINNTLVGVISPDNNILELIKEHFADRLKNEVWAIIDEKRSLMLIHGATGEMFLTVLREEEVLEIKGFSESNSFSELWKIFFQSIEIAERRNPQLQKRFVPVKYRQNMNEFN